MAASHFGSFVVNGSLLQVNALLCDPAFSRSMGFAFASHTSVPNQVILVFTSDVTFTSWGEIMRITLSATGANETRMDIHSECAMPTQIIDWGKNKENVDRIVGYVWQNLTRINYVNTQATQAQSKRFCQGCGAPLSADAKFCQKCGRKVP